MKRQAEFLVTKRDGRREWLRATKLAHSIHASLAAAGVVTRERSLDLATEIVGLLRQGRGDDMLATDRIAEMVRRVLIERGYSLAALLYVEVRARGGASAVVDDVGVAPFWSDERLFGMN